MDTNPSPTGKTLDLGKLRDKFPESEIEWRIGRAGEKAGKVWALALPFITNRAIMTRLDEVCGPENWKNEFKPGPQGGVVCGLSIRVQGEWVCKWDGADNTDVESVKGGLSDAMKRAGVQWGIGRYLYDLGETFAVIDLKGQHPGVYKDAAGKPVRFRWNPPKLPVTALPGESVPRKEETQAQPKQATSPQATLQQIGYIEKLVKEKGLYDPKNLFAPFGLQGAPTKAQAMKIIDQLKTAKPRPQAGQVKAASTQAA